MTSPLQPSSSADPANRPVHPRESDAAASSRLELEAGIERAVATTAGHLLIFGWAVDEGCSGLALGLRANEPASLSTISVLRHAHVDAEIMRAAPIDYDFGFVGFAKVPAGAPLPDQLSLSAEGYHRSIDLKPECVSQRRLLEELFSFLGFFQAHGGRETALSRFLAEGGRELIGELVVRCQKQAARIQQAENFGLRRAGPSFMTVLFGSVEAAMFQPLLFAKAKVAFGEWIYVCNSPEQAEDLLRLARTASRLHDLPIRVIVLNGNAGFGAANNLAIGMAASADIVLVNPDVHPIAPWADRLNRAIAAERFGKTLRGGLLFYDDEMLMHGGMYLEEDVFIARARDAAATPCRLLRVEHYDKGVPFIEAEWTKPRPVAAVTGAVMAFDRGTFEKLDGFSSDFAYGHYEDADLCLRWGDQIGPVEVDPDIRLVHLEGQGSKAHLPYFHGAASVNRHVFDLRNRGSRAAGLPALAGPGV